MEEISVIKRKWFISELEKLKKKGITRAEVARRLDILPQSLNNVLNGNRGISDGMLDKFIEAFDIRQIELLPKAPEPVAHRTEESDRAAIPLIPYDAIAGYGSFDFQELPIEDFYTVAELRGADFLIRVKGDSMSPKYNGGDIVACKRIDAITFWQWHKVYAICTRNQGILIKRVEEYQNNPAFITCRSENPQYRPFELHEDEIVSVALVLGAIVLE